MKAVLTTTDDIAGLTTLKSISLATRFNAWMYKTIKPYIKGRILELGSGIGNITDHLVTDFSEITISDYNPDYCSFLKNKYTNNKNIEDVLQIDLQDPNFFQTYRHLQNSFDTIILLNVIEHLEHDGKCAEYCQFLLKPDGHFIALAPAFSYLYSPLDKEIGHYRRYTKSSLAMVLQNNGFSILHKQYFNAMGIAGWLVINKWLGRTAITEGSMKFFEKLVPLAKITDRMIGRWVGLSAIAVGKKI